MRDCNELARQAEAGRRGIAGPDGPLIGLQALGQPSSAIGPGSVILMRTSISVP
jgi:hypothetical protein